MQVEVATRAQGLTAKMQFQREENGEFINGLGPQGDIFLTTRPITISIKLAAGLVENFFLETKKGILRTPMVIPRNFSLCIKAMTFLVDRVRAEQRLKQRTVYFSKEPSYCKMDRARAYSGTVSSFNRALARAHQRKQPIDSPVTRTLSEP